MASRNIIARPALAVYNQAPTGPSDPYWDNVSLLLPFDGNNGDTTTTDLSLYGSAMTFELPGNVTEISTTQSKFGGSSAYVGNPSGTISTPYDGSRFNFWDTTDYTIEAWVYASSWFKWSLYSTRDVPFLITHTGPGLLWGFGPNEQGGLSIYGKRLGTGSESGHSTSAGVLPTNEWVHILAHVTTNNSFGTPFVRFFINGVQSGSGSYSDVMQSNESGTLNIFTPSQTQMFGYVDDVRITKGVNRYFTTPFGTAVVDPFDVPTAAHPTS